MLIRLQILAFVYKYPTIKGIASSEWVYVVRLMHFYGAIYKNQTKHIILWLVFFI